MPKKIVKIGPKDQQDNKQLQTGKNLPESKATFKVVGAYTLPYDSNTDQPELEIPTGFPIEIPRSEKKDQYEEALSGLIKFTREPENADLLKDVGYVINRHSMKMLATKSNYNFKCDKKNGMSFLYADDTNSTARAKKRGLACEEALHKTKQTDDVEHKSVLKITVPGLEKTVLMSAQMDGTLDREQAEVKSTSNWNTFVGKNGESILLQCWLGHVETLIVCFVQEEKIAQVNTYTVEEFFDCLKNQLTGKANADNRFSLVKPTETFEELKKKWETNILKALNSLPVDLKEGEHTMKFLNRTFRVIATARQPSQESRKRQAIQKLNGDDEDRSQKVGGKRGHIRVDTKPSAKNVPTARQTSREKREPQKRKSDEIDEDRSQKVGGKRGHK